MTIRAIIVDDEAPARLEMRYLLEKVDDIEVLGEAGSADEALKLMNAICYDIAFLDIDMPGMSGLDMVEQMEKLDCRPAVIFTTAYGQFAVKAFELDVADYLLKPIAEDRLNKAIARVKKRLKKWDGKAPVKSKDAASKSMLLDRIPVTRQSKTFLLCPAEIYFIESHGEYTVVESEKGRFVSSLRLKDFEARLSPRSFFRSHRSFVVNLDHVSEMTTLYGGLYMLKIKDPGSSEVPVSRRQTKRLKHLLGM
ncbi:MAG: LytTR family DNA-binding domain-containing protein [Actinomycetota bacterium]|nr:LytTR family DNA-binding domain-containing protein [Actinomycetota bacterium]